MKKPELFVKGAIATLAGISLLAASNGQHYSPTPTPPTQVSRELTNCMDQDIRIMYLETRVETDTPTVRIEHFWPVGEVTYQVHNRRPAPCASPGELELRSSGFRPVPGEGNRVKIGAVYVRNTYELETPLVRP